jgi:hypothetical protein
MFKQWNGKASGHIRIRQDGVLNSRSQISGKTYGEQKPTRYYERISWIRCSDALWRAEGDHQRGVSRLHRLYPLFQPRLKFH